MTRKCFISFKTEDATYKEEIQRMEIDLIDKSLNEAIDSDDEDYIMQVIRREHLSDSTVTIHLIGARSHEDLGLDEQVFIKRELQASLYNGRENTRNGILGVVLPGMYEKIFRGDIDCVSCGETHRHVALDDSTVVREFSANYYVPNDKCHHTDEDRYCVLVRWDDFTKWPEKYIEDAFAKRAHPISQSVRVYPK